ncbi:hypothetical protein A0J48_001930 [Sphaerospermopsis aphanizomenoides BCCUSP55]|uniref:hypothetical protein n=1 Tax=Sphaerospermopsis aphanizomenoides TaxID=459663 RepID=UPI00190358A4|nr:hypothetical protein [Sphaerospermopsis aphanizomenoides]MBK1986322.1 hypothetical protein [Sphaerospermopsis aphanizomenoides BCCUSP55]
MLYSFTFPQEIIDSIQERIKVLERCLNDANPQDEVMAEILELANSRQITLSQFQDEVINLLYKLNKFMKLAEVVKVKEQQNELSILLFVRYILGFKDILDQYWDFMFIAYGKRIFKILLEYVYSTYNIIENQRASSSYSEQEKYIFEETIRNLMQSLIKFSLRTRLVTEEEAKAFNKENNIPQESEAMLISLASTKKWDYVYRKLA